MAINWATIECIQKVLNKFTVIGLLEVTNTFQKPYYNILLDDRAGLEESYEILKYVVDEIIKLN